MSDRSLSSNPIDDLVRLLNTRQADEGDTLARKAADELERLLAALVSVQECISHQDFMKVRRVVASALAGSKAGEKPRALPTSNQESISAPHDLALPKITAEIWESYQDEEFIEDYPRWAWTQAAVDFACEIVRPAVWAEIARLRGDVAALQAVAHERLEELKRWRSGCTGLHGSQMPCVPAVETTTDRGRR